MTTTLRTKRIRSLGALPDGNHAYLQSLRKFITWLSREKNPSRATFIKWLQEEGIYESSAAGYWQIIVKLGFVISSLSTTRLTDFAKEFLRSNELQQAELLFEKLYTELEGMAQVATFYLDTRQAPLHLSEIAKGFETSPTRISLTAIEQRIHWLASLGFIEETLPRTYSLSAFGQLLANKHMLRSQTVNSAKSELDYSDYLIQELISTARQSKQYYRLEKALEETFSFFGYYAERISGRAVTDVLLEARILEHQYSSIVDGKSRKKGKVPEVNLDKILAHKSKHQADYALVIAEDFSDGGLIEYAEERGVTLMTIGLLCKWIKLHRTTPLNLIDYQAFFASPGLLKEIPLVIQRKADEIKTHRAIIKKLALIIHEQNQDKLYIEQSPDAMRTAISVAKKELLDRDVILKAMQLLYHPVVNAAYRDKNDGMYLAMSLPTIALALRGLADELDGGI